MRHAIRNMRYAHGGSKISDIRCSSQLTAHSSQLTAHGSHSSAASLSRLNAFEAMMQVISGSGDTEEVS
jgi:hypothetical protein